MPRTWLDREAWKIGKEDVFPNEKYSSQSWYSSVKGSAGTGLWREREAFSLGPDRYQGATGFLQTTILPSSALKKQLHNRTSAITEVGYLFLI